MSQPTDTGSQQFGSVESLLGSLEAAKQLTTPAQAQPDLESVELADPQPVEAEDETPAVSLNQPIPAQPAPALAPTVEADPEPVAAPALVTKHFETPAIEAEIADDAKRAKDDGSYTELKNVLLDVMKTLRSETATPNAQADRVKQALDNLVFDPNNLSIDTESNSNPIIIQQQLTILESVKPTSSFPVIALKSGYRATMTALNNNEKLQIRNIKGSIYDQTVAVLRLIHAKISETSVGKLKFDDFLKITAEDDYDTILYGLYYSTFPSETEYTITCPHCARENSMKLCPDHLIEVIDVERAGQYVHEVLNGYNRGKEFLQNSMVAKPVRKILPESKMVFEIATPTLRKLLDNLRLLDSMSHYQGEMVALVKYTDKVFVPNIQAAAQGHASFFQVTEAVEIIGIINKLSSTDIAALRKAISERIRQYRVQYRIPSFNCADTACAKPIDNISIDLMRLFFYVIGAEQLG